MINSTLTNNQIYSSLGSGLGGGAFVEGDLVLDHSTITHNSVAIASGGLTQSGGADVGGQDGAGAGVERQPTCGPATRRHPDAAVGEEPRALQCVEPGSDRGAGQACLARQFGTSARHTVEQQPQQLPRRCRRSPRYVRHRPSEPGKTD